MYQSHVIFAIVNLVLIRVTSLREIREKHGVSKYRFQIRENQEKSTFLRNSENFVINYYVK